MQSRRAVFCASKYGRLIAFLWQFGGAEEMRRAGRPVIMNQAAERSSSWGAGQQEQVPPPRA